MPPNLPQTLDLALHHHMAGRFALAEPLYRQILAIDPRHPDATHFLGLLAHQTGHSAAAVDLIGSAIQYGLDTPEAHGNLGNALLGTGQIDQAITAFNRSISLRPIAPTFINLGNAWQAKGDVPQAIAAYRQAIVVDPHFPEAHNNLGNALTAQGNYQEAILACSHAVSLRPGYLDALVNLGNAQRFSGQLEDAIATYRTALSHLPPISTPNPDIATVQSNLASALNDLGRLDEALTAYRQAARLAPDDPRHGDNILLNIHYQPTFNAAAIVRENAEWNTRFALPLSRLTPSHPIKRIPNRKLRIGYVSSDFRDHVVGRNILPLFREHDRNSFEIYCYSNAPAIDEIAKEFQTLSDSFQNIAHLSDDQAAAQIRTDQIDILVDLGLHTYGNRLLIFARKPAPVQITFAGYPASTGLTAIDYRISDPYLDPPGMDESIYSEKVIRLPNSFWCYDPLDCADIPVDPLPMAANGFVTFGCLNNFCKINDEVLSLWAKVLQQLPDSHLLLLTRAGSQNQRALNHLAGEGINPDRIRFATSGSRRAYLRVYQQIDIGLDTFPYNGHTTSLDSFWMGVPVVSLIGTRSVARAGWCQLSNLGLTELAARSAEEFTQIASGLANDLPRLTHLRATLRNRMEQSPLMDAKIFAQEIENVYRQIR